MASAATAAAIALLAAIASTAAAGQAPAPAGTGGADQPAPPAPPGEPVRTKGCSPAVPPADSTEIVVCAERVEGYRLNSDVLAAKRAMRSGGRPTRPGPGAIKDRSCATVGPMGCRDGAGINVVSAAVVAGTMLARAVKGENVGEMFITDPTPSEYELYLAAKRQREQREAEAAAKLKSAAAKAQPEVAD